MPHVLVSLPPMSIASGLRMVDRGAPDPHLIRSQHADFCDRLIRLGYEVFDLPPQEHYPDSVFIEDPAVIIPNFLYAKARFRPISRIGEEEILADALRDIYPIQGAIQAPGTLEGGDVLICEKSRTVYVGISKRTNEEGARQLAQCLLHTGYTLKTVRLGPDKLHLKGECSYHRDAEKEGLILTSHTLFPAFEHAKEHVIVIDCDDPAQRFGPNCISKGGCFLVHEGCEAAAEILVKRGFAVEFIDLSEFDLIDGAMTCLWKQY